MIDEGGYQHLLSAIYDLVFAPTDWPLVLRLLCSYAASVTTTPERDTPRSLGAVGITADDHREFLRTWHKRNVFSARQPAREAGAIVLGRTILPKPALLCSPMYQQYLAPREIEEVVRLGSTSCRPALIAPAKCIYRALVQTIRLTGHAPRWPAAPLLWRWSARGHRRRAPSCTGRHGARNISNAPDAPIGTDEYSARRVKPGCSTTARSRPRRQSTPARRWR
jgi:hypothetical protein